MFEGNKFYRLLLYGCELDPDNGIISLLVVTGRLMAHAGSDGDVLVELLTDNHYSNPAVITPGAREKRAGLDHRQ